VLSNFQAHHPPTMSGPRNITITINVMSTTMPKTVATCCCVDPCLSGLCRHRCRRGKEVGYTMVIELVTILVAMCSRKMLTYILGLGELPAVCHIRLCCVRSALCKKLVYTIRLLNDNYEC
jgi:hypothetical protein